MSQEAKPKTDGLIWEQPLGTIRGVLKEPGPRFVDPHAAEERKAIQEIDGYQGLVTRTGPTPIKDK